MVMTKRNNAVFFIIIAVFSLYAILFIIRTSFVIDGERYFSLCDDAMISMRYAKNLATGHGLVWNPGGERVEGFTNPLWVIIMAGVHLFPVPPSKVSLIVQLVAALILLINLFVIKKVAEFISDASPFVVLGAVFLTGFYLPLINWSLQGMEVGLLTLIISISTLKALECLQEKSSPIWLYTLLGLGILVRIDMLVIFISILFFFLLFDPINRKKHMSSSILMLSIFLIPQTLLRLWYFNDILPNTYYLKMTGFPVFFRLSRGLISLIEFFCSLNMLIFLAFIVSLVWVRQKSFLLLVWIFLAQVLYHVYVGGDAWSAWGSRYITMVMPIFFLLLCYGLSKLELPDGIKGLKEKAPSSLVKALPVLFLIFCLINVNLINGRLRCFLLETRPLDVTDNVNMIKMSLLLKEITHRNAKIAVVWAGIIPYFTDRYCIDLLGKNDRIIAHQKMRNTSGLKQLVFFYPGHLKWDYSYSIGHLKPDVVAQIRGTSEEALNYLHDDYQKIKFDTGFIPFLRKNSPNILWDKIDDLVKRPKFPPL